MVQEGLGEEDFARRDKPERADLRVRVRARMWQALGVRVREGRGRPQEGSMGNVRDCDLEL